MSWKNILRKFSVETIKNGIKGLEANEIFDIKYVKTYQSIANQKHFEFLMELDTSDFILFFDNIKYKVDKITYLLVIDIKIYAGRSHIYGRLALKNLPIAGFEEYPFKPVNPRKISDLRDNQYAVTQRIDADIPTAMKLFFEKLDSVLLDEYVSLRDYFIRE